MYYAFDASFSDYFGSNGEFAVQQAFDLLNGVMNGQGNNALYLYSPTNGLRGDTNGSPAITLFPTNSLDNYSANLTEFPFNSEGENYTASALGLLDVKSINPGRAHGTVGAGGFGSLHLGLAQSVHRYHRGILQRARAGLQ